MDVGTLLREARRRAQLDQRLLAERAGTSKSAIWRYEHGQTSPTVATLDRLLAACGLQARVQLEPLLAHVDARVDAMLAGEPELETTELAGLVRSLDDRPGAPSFSLAGPAERRGPARWAFDGAVALQLHGLAVAADMPAVVVVWDEAARYWLMAIGARGRDPRGDVVSWHAADAAEVRDGLRECCVSLVFMQLRVRLVDALPPTVSLSVGWCEHPVPVVTVDEVEQTHPEHAEVLQRWRERRAG